MLRNGPIRPILRDRRANERATKDSPVAKALKHPKSLRAAINAKCYDCAGYSRIEVTRCTVEDCPLWPLRPWQRT